MKTSQSQKSVFIAAVILVFTLFFVSCDKEDDNPNLKANEYLLAFMDYWYLWYNQMPSVKAENYQSPVELLEALRYQPLDKWSYITTKQQLQAYYEEGTYVGFGFGSAFDQNNSLWITFVFNNSPLVEFGIDRGWRILSINGTTPTPQNVNELMGPASVGVERTFTFGGPNGEQLTRPVAKGLIAMNSVLMDSVYTFGSQKIGYFVFKSFIGPSVSELNDVFSRFQLEGVNELIVDLRYNTGGSLGVSTHLAGLIGGVIANSQVFTTLVHNEKRLDKNTSYYIESKSNSIYFNRVVFITTGSSASASEVLINGLKPHMGVTLVGSKTYGKPVGMYAVDYDEFDWAFVPICFKVVNALNEGDFYSGIPVNFPYADGVAYPFGDLNEYSLYGAIGYLTGSVAKAQTVEPEKELNYPDLVGLQGDIGAW